MMEEALVLWILEAYKEMFYFLLLGLSMVLHQFYVNSLGRISIQHRFYHHTFVFYRLGVFISQVQLFSSPMTLGNTRLPLSYFALL